MHEEEPPDDPAWLAIPERQRTAPIPLIRSGKVRPALPYATPLRRRPAFGAGGPARAREERGIMDAGDQSPPANPLAPNPKNPDNPDQTAGVTFLGQFIDHDMTFDPTSSLEQQVDPEI